MMKKCPYCAEEIQDAAIVCRFCQRPLSSTIVPPTTATVTTTAAPITLRTWSPGVAAVLTVFVPGLGHLYKGYVGFGIVVFLVTVLGYVFLIVPGVVIHILAIVDASTAGRRRRPKRPPQPHSSPGLGRQNHSMFR